MVDDLERKSLVYFLLSGNRVKIGTTTDVTSRLSYYKPGLPDDTEVLGILDGGREKELEIHTRFAASRVRGEWFEATPDILSWARHNTTPYFPENHRKDETPGRSFDLAELSFLLKMIAQDSPIPLQRIRDRVAYVQSVLPSMKPSRVFSFWYAIETARPTEDEIKIIRAAAKSEDIFSPGDAAPTDPILLALGEISTRLSVLERAVKDVRIILSRRVAPIGYGSLITPEEESRRHA